MFKVSLIATLLLTCTIYASDNETNTKQLGMDYYLHPLTQEIIKKGLATHGIGYFDEKNRKAEEKAAAYNANPENQRWMVPSWRFKTTFNPVDKERDQLTRKVYDALTIAQSKNDHAQEGDLIGDYPWGQTEYAVQADGSVRCSIDMQGAYELLKKECHKNQ